MNLKLPAVLAAAIVLISSCTSSRSTSPTRLRGGASSRWPPSRTPRTTGPALEQIETARRICGACGVRSECIEFALATNQEAGIWGGTTEEERRKLRKVWLAKQRLVAS